MTDTKNTEPELATPWSDRSLEGREYGNTCKSCGSGPRERCTITETDSKQGSSKGHPVGGIYHGAHFFRGWE